MKKAALILLLTIYSLSVVGVSLKEFYCCGKLKSVTVTLAQAGKDKCGKMDDKDCCQTRYQFFKVKDNHLASGDIGIPAKNFTDASFFTPSYHAIVFASQQADVIVGSHAPPLYRGVDIYLFNRAFRI